MGAFDDAMMTIKTTVPKYLRGATDMTIRKRLILKLLQQSGNIIFNVKAPKMVWDVEVREHTVRTLSAGSNNHQFGTLDPYEQLEINHSELEATDSLERRIQMINANSPQAIVDIGSTKMERLVRVMTRELARQFYTDNTSGTNVGRMTGIRSLFTPETGGGVGSRLLARPAAGSTYGGKSTELGNLGGQWSANLGTSPTNALTDWPWGSGSAEYDYLTPKMFNYSASWEGDSGWANACLKILRRAKSAIERNGGEGAAPMVHVLETNLFHQVKDKLDARERILVGDYTKALGFPDTLMYEGALITDDFDCPAGRGYSLNPNEMALYSVHSDLFFTDGPVWQTPEQSTLFLIGFLGNWRWNPKFFAEIAAYA